VNIRTVTGFCVDDMVQGLVSRCVCMSSLTTWPNSAFCLLQMISSMLGRPTVAAVSIFFTQLYCFTPPICRWHLIWKDCSLRMSARCVHAAGPYSMVIRLLTELDKGNISCQFCISCTGFLSKDMLTLNWHASSSHLCPAGHLRTWLMTYTWSWKVLHIGSAHPLIDCVPFHAHTTHLVTGALELCTSTLAQQGQYLQQFQA